MDPSKILPRTLGSQVCTEFPSGSRLRIGAGGYLADFSGDYRFTFVAGILRIFLSTAAG